MTSLFQARRRVEEFAAAVDGRGPAHAHSEEITTLLGLVARMRDEAQVAPRPEFAADLRSRLMAEAQVALTPQTAGLLLPVREPGRRERRLVAAASAFVLIGGTTTMAAASQSALPGDALYPIKRGIERVEAGLSTSPAGKGQDLLDQAGRRLAEAQGLVAESSPQSTIRVPETIAAFSMSAEEGSGLLFESFEETGNPDAIVEVRTFTTGAITVVEGLAADAPPEARDELTAAALLLHEIDAEAAALCSTCAADLPPVEVPDLFLAGAEVDRVMRLAAIRELSNDHPVPVDEKLARVTTHDAKAPRAGAPKQAAPEGGVVATPAPAAPAPAAPAPTSEPESWPSLLPGDLGGALEDGLDSGGSTTIDNDTPTLEDTAEDITGEVGEVTEELGDAVTTILPETDVDLLP